MVGRSTLGISVGLATGLVLASLSFGVGFTHTVCSPGPQIGKSGPLLTPEAFAVAPPGGLVNASIVLRSSFNTGPPIAASRESLDPTNYSWWIFGNSTWNLSAQNSSQVAGWGPAVSCATPILTPSVPSDSCQGCLLTSAVPSDVGSRVTIPSQLDVDNVSSAVMNFTYPATPVASFGWNAISSGISIDHPAGLDSIGAGYGSFYEGGQLVGLAITFDITSVGFQVPIQLFGGGQELEEASYPADWSGGPSDQTVAWINFTYIFPVEDTQGSWSVYLPGGGGPNSPGGLLFIRTAV